MGQIVIDIPTKAKRRYIVTEKSRVAALLSALDASATRVRNVSVGRTKEHLEDIEDIEDTRDSEKAMAEYRRTGVSYSWEEIKAEMGL